MADQDVINDVRAAKRWVDAESATFAELGERLAAVARAYEARAGEFACVPKERPESVQQAIETAGDEPGRELLNEVRSARLP